MGELPPQAVPMLYPVLMIFIAVVAVLATLIGGLWAGFRWLHGQIEETSTKIVKPVEERVALVEKSTDAAHRRIDEWMGARR
jgi:hypothetical protein